jgi:hypothetical protein
MITLPHFSLSQKMTALILFNERSLQLLKDLVTRQKILGQPIGQITKQRNGITDKNNQTKNAFTRKRNTIMGLIQLPHMYFFILTQ